MKNKLKKIKESQWTAPVLLVGGGVLIGFGICRVFDASAIDAYKAAKRSLKNSGAILYIEKRSADILNEHGGEIVFNDMLGDFVLKAGKGTENYVTI